MTAIPEVQWAPDDDTLEEGIEQVFRFALARAVLAPSGHNTQPWLFAICDGVLNLYLDRRRALPVVDPEDRELIMSCGAALFHLRIALRCLGYRPEVELQPDPADASLLARVRLGERADALPEEEALSEVMARRRTNRSPFEEHPVPEVLLAHLATAAEEEGAHLRVVTDPGERDAVAELIAEGDRFQGSDAAFRQELAAWIHPNRSRARDGMPGHAFGAGDLKSYLGPLVIRTFDWGGGQAARDRQLALGSPVLVVLATESDSPEAWLRAGQALARVLLRATVDGVSASFLNQPIEVAALRPRLQAALRLQTMPQILLRMGYGPLVRPTPRRAVEEVLRRP